MLKLVIFITFFVIVRSQSMTEETSSPYANSENKQSLDELISEPKSDNDNNRVIGDNTQINGQNIDVKSNSQQGSGGTQNPESSNSSKNINLGCGIRNVDGVGFRTPSSLGNVAQFGEFPWTVAILKEEKALDEQIFNVYVCGGSLIDPGVVLTAAHCVDQKDPKILKIRAGEWDTQTKDEPYPHQDRAVRDYVIHPEYHHGTLFNDIALLFLIQPVEIAENVNTVCLPNADDIFDNARCFASAWGQDRFGKEGKYSVILKRDELPIVPRETCVQKLRETRLGRHFQLHSSFICAGGERGDTCKGDGGSALVCPIPNAPHRYVQTGIVAWGIGCGNSTPGVYANVQMFRNWVDKQMELNHLTIKSYLYR
ncbi:phenoloxidase-activating factor 2-like isoform X2 [Contarinia nasturtii]|uniref:phenoloxidase-activating factor 2-like isoform X2 n=1 Tax=Contarinia nasturtii TaxID=265458 RepID=UPI0012D407C9|nr:phenoloxidase-activating factor 2-like isoform X2 [Contarinia nasturtii]